MLTTEKAVCIQCDRTVKVDTRHVRSRDPETGIAYVRCGCESDADDDFTYRVVAHKVDSARARNRELDRRRKRTKAQRVARRKSRI